MTRRICLILIAAVLGACQPAAAGPASVPSRAASAVATRPATPTAVPSTLTPIPPAQSNAPTPTIAPTPEPPPAAAFALNLHEEGDFVPQHTFEWCVGASIQMAHNLVRNDHRGSYEDQEQMWELARSHSSNSFNGANPRGWAMALEEIGLGPYELVSVPDYNDALRTAAAAIRETERPVGLVMWRGRHAWVMSGFESFGDPAIHSDFDVTGIRVLDPLYPHGSGVWGPSPPPNALLTPDELATQFVVRESRRWSSELGTGYLLVVPTSAS